MSFGTKSDGSPILEYSDSVYMNGLHVATGPQLTASLKLSFFHSKMWFADITCTYYDWNFLDIAPSRRMQGLYTGTRTDGTVVNGSYRTVSSGVDQTTVNAVMMDESGNMILDKFGTPRLMYPYDLMVSQWPVRMFGTDSSSMPA